jgi:hypothetical protein
LDGKQCNEDRDCRRHHVGAETRRCECEPFECRQHGNCRSDGAVTVNESRAEQSERHNRRPPLPLDAQHKGEDAAFAVIVHPHRDGDVFDRGDHDQGPHDHGTSVAGEVQHSLESVEWACSNIAEYHAERRKVQSRDATLTRITFWHHCDGALWHPTYICDLNIDGGFSTITQQRQSYRVTDSYLLELISQI